MSEYGYQSGGLYRSRDGMIAGVCAGLADHFDFSVFWMRAIAVALLLCTGIWPALIVYVVAALMMKKTPYVRWDR